MSRAFAPRLIHIRRMPLHWRANDLTECGRVAAECMSVPWNEVPERARAVGPGGMCKTCVSGSNQTASHVSSYQKSGRGDLCELERVIQRAKAGRYPRIVADIRALGELVRRHREEFEPLADALLAEMVLSQGLHPRRKKAG